MASIAAEYPSWEVFNAFTAFNLNLTKTAFINASLCRLSAVYHLDAEQQQSEYDDYRLFAQRRSAQGIDNLSAWCESVRAVDRSSSLVTANHPREHLRSAICRYALCMGATTSGANRSFASILTVIS